MAKPPVDANPEKFIIGRRGYSNLQTATPYFDQQGFRIDPAPMPVRAIIVCNVVFAALCFGFFWVPWHYGGKPAGLWVAALIGGGLFTCIGFTAIVYYSFDRARRLGPWLIFEKATGRVTLPRERMSFERHEIVHLQYVTTKRLDWGGVLNNDRLSELNLITCCGGERKRWPLLRSIFAVKAFDRLLKPLLEHTDLPVMRVKDQRLGWKITEKPYGRSDNK
jgi:hypothetical protein